MLDDASGLCIGCGRCGDEIARWAEMAPEQRRAVMNMLPERLDRMERTLEAPGAKP